ncbi:hypothetical protein EKO27_g5480 [Xylaria grammica]|uniref:Uncharacterized protein n=1 Tax=Xylaria grammica TaxID=363999 RepID=A0A439D5F4_9PEZI|nr:hypothetical protein EKO27_g5480 [Xylaria grammica]
MTPSVIMQTTADVLPEQADHSSLTQPDETKMKLRVPKPVKEPEQRRSVRIPDLFSSIMSTRPVVNQNHFKVKAEGDRWISKIMNMDEKTSAKNTKSDFCLLSSMWVPTAGEEALRTMLDWNNWIFYFDDEFDEGHLRDDLVAAREEIDQTMAIMEEGAAIYTPEENPIRYVFQTCWQRVVKGASPGMP